MRQIINIKDASAPSSYDFPVELASEDKLELTENGGAVITTKDLNFDSLKAADLVAHLPADLDKNVAKLIKSGRMVKVIIGKPWAIDANKKELKTWYTVESNNILKQHIELKGAVFPVVADPVWCGNQISYTGWWQNPDSNHWTLSVYPSSCGFYMVAAAWGLWYSDAWSSVCNASGTGGYCNYWTNDQYASMFYQFVCHYNVIGSLKAGVPGSTRGAWNLDEWRPNVGWASTLGAICNP